MKNIIIFICVISLIGCTQDENATDNEITNKVLELEDEINSLKEDNESLENSVREQENTIESMSDDLNQSESEEYSWIKEVDELNQDNSIDSNYESKIERFNESKDFSIIGLTDIDYEYASYWEDEINNCVGIISSQLDDESEQNFIETQSYWKEYVEKEREYNFSTYVLSGNFGSSGYLMVSGEYYQAMRTRALKLIEYYYILNWGNEQTNEYIFKYSQ